MCLNRDIEYHSSSDALNLIHDIDLEWPIQNGSKLIVACNFCFYPITFEEHVTDEIRDENNISFGIVIPMNKLFRKIIIFHDDPLEQWKTGIVCPSCYTVLSFITRSNLSELNFEKVSNYTSYGEQIVILDLPQTYRGSSEEAKKRFADTVLILG